MIGTPKTLRQAVANGLGDRVHIIRESNEADLVFSVTQHVQDLLAQKFGAAMCSYDDETAKRMAVLFKRILEG